MLLRRVLLAVAWLWAGAAWAASTGVSSSIGWLTKSPMKVTASFAADRASMLIDGTLGSDDSGAWNSGWIPGSTFPISATIDMGQVFDLSALRYWQGNGHGANAPVFSLSTDGVNFTAVTPIAQSINNWNAWNPTTAASTSQGVTYRTASEIMFGYQYDAARTALLALPAADDGAAFTNPAGAHLYVLWTKTTTDRHETNLSQYSFPAALGLHRVSRREWDYSATLKVTRMPATNIVLHASPGYFQ